MFTATDHLVIERGLLLIYICAQKHEHELQVIL